MNILSFQSRVAYGYVGNSIAVPVLQRLGHETWPVDTTALSNHLAYPTHTGRFLPPAEVAAVVHGLAMLGLFGRLDAMLSGFLGDAATVAAEAADRLRAESPAAIYCLDPVMGERVGGLYVRPSTAEAIAGLLLPRADLLLPNAFELDRLAGMRCRSLSDAIAAAESLRLRARPGALVIATGLEREDGPKDRIEVLALTADRRWLGEAPRVAVEAFGGGDLFSAVFLSHYLATHDVPQALARSMDSAHAVFARTIGHKELALIESLDALADPPKLAQLRRLL
jgi:pyridoxine kinase